MRPLKSVSFLFLLFLSTVCAAIPAREGNASVESLRATEQRVAERLAKSPFGQPLHLEAAEKDGQLTGHAYALLSYPFAQAAEPLADATQWCDILLLPFNTKHCETSAAAPGRLALSVFVGRKYTTPLERTHRIDFRFEVVSRTADYLRVTLSAPEGPFGTRDYRIVLELKPAENGRSFLHLGYSYSYGAIARTAMQAYLSTVGSEKIGFSIEGKDPQGKPIPVRGVRGVMERNTMRYYLAIESYLRALRVPAAERPARMIEAWFESVERYPRQLHELERGEYVPMKRAEFERMRAGLSRARRTASSSP